MTGTERFEGIAIANGANADVDPPNSLNDVSLRHAAKTPHGEVFACTPANDQQVSGFEPVIEEPGIADFLKTFWQDMQKEEADEHNTRECNGSGRAVTIIFRRE